jgi:hypothetical protein
MRPRAAKLEVKELVTFQTSPKDPRMTINGIRNNHGIFSTFFSDVISSFAIFLPYLFNFR